MTCIYDLCIIGEGLELILFENGWLAQCQSLFLTFIALTQLNGIMNENKLRLIP